MRKILLVLLCLCASICSLFALGSSESKDAGSYKIGFIGPMTGDNANYGIRISNAVKLAVSEINEKGGINGKPVELIIEDSEGSTEKGLAAIEKLSSQDKIVGLIGPVFTGVSFAVGERVQAEGIPMITPSATHKDITAIGSYVFRTVVSDGLQGEVAGNYFYQELGYRNIGVLYVKNDYSQGLYEGMSKAFIACGGKIGDVETAQLGDKDFKTQLTKLKASGVEAIYIPNYTVEMAQILEQAAQLGVTAKFLSCDGFSDPEIYKLAPDYTDGVVYIGPAQVEESQKYKDFYEKYKSLYGEGPDSFSCNGYDAAYVMFDALSRSDNTRSSLRDASAQTKDFEGVNGLINFLDNGDLVAYQGVYKVNGTTPEYLGAYTVKDGKLVKVE